MAKDYQIEDISNIPKTLTDSYQEVFTKTQDDIIFYEAVWRLNTTRVLVKMKIDGEQIFEVNLDDLKSDWKLSPPGGSSAVASMARIFGISQYASGRWHFKPPIGITADSSFTIEMKKTSGGDKRLEEGKVAWGKK